jgi:cytosine permease
MSRLAVPAMLVLVAVSLSIAARDLAGVEVPPPTGDLDLGSALAIVIGTFISGGIQATNWSRFARTGRSAMNWAGVVSYVVASAIAYFTGNAGLGIGPVNGIVSAVILYAVFCKAIPQPVQPIPTTME